MPVLILLRDVPLHGSGAASAAVQPRRRPRSAVALAVLDDAVSVRVWALYGGYFGAGIGILMLAALSLMGHTDIHQMNGLKNLLATCINAVAAVYFMFAGLVSWPDALVMAVGAIVGGVGGASWRDGWAARRCGGSSS